MIAKEYKKVLKFIKENPNCSLNQLQNKFKKNENIESIVAELHDKNYIRTDSFHLSTHFFKKTTPVFQTGVALIHLLWAL